MRDLTPEELTHISGGTDGASMGLNIGTDSLLSLEFKWQQGDNYHDYKLEAGKGLSLNLDAFVNGIYAS